MAAPPAGGFIAGSDGNAFDQGRQQKNRLLTCTIQMMRTLDETDELFGLTNVDGSIVTLLGRAMSYKSADEQASGAESFLLDDNTGQVWCQMYNSRDNNEDKDIWENIEKKQGKYYVQVFGKWVKVTGSNSQFTVYGIKANFDYNWITGFYLRCMKTAALLYAESKDGGSLNTSINHNMGNDSMTDFNVNMGDGGDEFMDADKMAIKEILQRHKVEGGIHIDAIVEHAKDKMSREKVIEVITNFEDGGTIYAGKGDEYWCLVDDE